MKKILFLPLLLFASAAVCQAKGPKSPKKEIVFVFENDAHSTLSGYAKIVTLKDSILAETKNVITASGGDFSADFMSRSTLGTKTEGAGIIQIMNKVGYDYVVPGNHDFDFGVPVMEDNFKSLEAVTVCCNFQETGVDESVFAGYSIRKIGGVKVAVVGVATPKTISSRNAKLFSDDDGNLRYTFNEDRLADLVQQNVDEARSVGKADYVIVLSHLGDKKNGSVTSLDLITGTSGIDAVLDAHAHSVIPERFVENKNGEDVLLMSTGLKFANIGLLTIGSDGSVSSKLIPTQDLEPDADTQAFIDALEAAHE
ncbi:MAG: metallophosphoesterase [Bacteroidaceae bacterium]|nr:metallophosphoesterase [Bacteroidaceae bacterium]